MAQDNTKSFVMYQGDGVNNVFSVPMDKGFYGKISVAFVRRGLDKYFQKPTTFTLNEDNSLLTWTGEPLQIGDYIVIERSTLRQQPYVFPNNQKPIEKADDNMERQIQEISDRVDQALKVDPTYAIDSDKMSPVDWLQTILRSKDRSVREIRFMNGQLFYSCVDPESAEDEKEWTALPNAFGFVSLRYQTYTKFDRQYRYIEATTDGENWFPVAGALPLQDSIFSTTIESLEWKKNNSGVDSLYISTADGGSVEIPGNFFEKLAEEVGRAMAVESSLQNQINKKADKAEVDELASLRHVRDIIETEAELRTYPIAANHIVEGDILIVRNTTGDMDLSYDETEHLDGEPTVWAYHAGGWHYKGALGYEAFNKIRERLSKIEEVIPDAASTTNQLADKAFVNSSVQTATANFRGNWATYADVPDQSAEYPADYAGSKIPTVNDYLVVADASDYQGETLVGTWRFKYSGTWATDGKNGWLPEYQVNEEPLTMAQLTALNSGVSEELLDDMQADIDRIDGKTAELDGDLQGKVDKSQGAENAGKFLKVGADGNVTLGEGGGGGSGVTEVAHDDTLTGKGTMEEPLSVVKPAAILVEW